MQARWANGTSSVLLADRITAEARTVQLRAGAAERGDPPCDESGDIIPGLRYIPGGLPRGVSVRAAAGVRAQLAAEARALLGLEVTG